MLATDEEEMRRFRCLTNFVYDPRVTEYRLVSYRRLSAPARRVLLRRTREVADRAWRGVEEHYGVRRGSPFCAVYASKSPLCLLTLTTDVRRAMDSATAWLGGGGAAGGSGAGGDAVGGVEIAVVGGGGGATVFPVLDSTGRLGSRRLDPAARPERYVAMAAAMAFTPQPVTPQPPPRAGGGAGGEEVTSP